jgi:hypothetical protein
VWQGRTVNRSGRTFWHSPSAMGAPQHSLVSLCRKTLKRIALPKANWSVRNQSGPRCCEAATVEFAAAPRQQVMDQLARPRMPHVVCGTLTRRAEVRSRRLLFGRRCGEAPPGGRVADALRAAAFLPRQWSGLSRDPGMCGELPITLHGTSRCLVSPSREPNSSTAPNNLN